MLLRWLNQKRRCCISSLNRRAGATGARRSLFAALSSSDVAAKKLLETWVAPTLKSQLRPPCSDDDWCGKTRIRSEHYVTFGAVIVPHCDVSKLINGLKPETFSVGDPHRTMLKGVNNVDIGDRLVVHAAVLPDGAVCAAGRRVAVVGNAGSGHVLVVGFGERVKTSNPRRSRRDDDNQDDGREGERANGPNYDSAAAIVDLRLFLNPFSFLTVRSAGHFAHYLSALELCGVFVPHFKCMRSPNGERSEHAIGVVPWNVAEQFVVSRYQVDRGPTSSAGTDAVADPGGARLRCFAET
jgi:hypothetical protein